MSPLPDGPYTYDDPRILYDEHCFFFDGDGYDNVCLNPGTAVVVRHRGRGSYSNARQRQRQQERGTFLNVFVQANLREVNGKHQIFDEDKSWVRFTGEDSPLGVVIAGVKIGMKVPYVEGYLRQVAETGATNDGLNATIKLINAKDTAPESFDTPKTPDQPLVEVKQVEAYEDIKVVCELIQPSNSTLEVSGQLFKKDNDE